MKITFESIIRIPKQLSQLDEIGLIEKIDTVSSYVTVNENGDWNEFTQIEIVPKDSNRATLRMFLSSDRIIEVYMKAANGCLLDFDTYGASETEAAEFIEVAKKLQEIIYTANLQHLQEL